LARSPAFAGSWHASPESIRSGYGYLIFKSFFCHDFIFTNTVVK
jgi:hypothetical protein